MQGLYNLMVNQNPHQYDVIGDSDPNLSPFWQEMLDLFPESKWVLIRRQPIDSALAIAKAMAAESYPVDMALVNQMTMAIQAGLDQLAKLVPWDKRMLVNYSDLDREATIKAIWRFLLPEIEFPQDRYEMLADMRVTLIFRNAASHLNPLFSKALYSKCQEVAA